MSHPFKDDGKRYSFPPALRQAFIAAKGEHRASLELLRDAICEYVEDLRRQGVPTRGIVGALRHRVADLQSSNGLATVGVAAHRIVDDMVNSCLDGDEIRSQPT